MWRRPVITRPRLLGNPFRQLCQKTFKPKDIKKGDKYILLKEEVLVKEKLKELEETILKFNTWRRRYYHEPTEFLATG